MSQTIAQEYGNPQIEQIHLLWALLADENGLIPQLLAGMGITLPSLTAAAKDLLARQPRAPPPVMRWGEFTSPATRKRP